MAVRMRPLAATAAGVLAAPLLPFAALPAFAEGEATPPPAQSFTDFCQNVPADYEPFTDIDGNPFKSAIECLAYVAVTRGGPGNLPDDQYGPEIEVGRDQMASFVANVIDTADRLDTGNNIQTLPPYDGTPSFSDIDGNTHEANISRLADAGIVSGGPGELPDDQYGPRRDVSRAQMATFINAALDYMTGTPGTTTNDYYTDDTGNTHERNINGITSLGIATGQGPDTYNPELAVDRDNMAVFLARTLGELEERGDIGPGTREQNIQVTPDSEATFDAVANPDTSAADDRSYTVTGLVPGEEYRVTLVEASTVGETADGETTFSDTDNDNLADVGTRTADITRVNGAQAENNTGDGTATTPTDSTNGGTAVGTATDRGELTFVVDGEEDGESVLPVVYRNGGSGNTAEEGGSSPRLELNDDGTPAEPFDTGGVITYVATDASIAVTDAPDLVSAAFVRFTGTGADEITTIRYTFDENVVAGVTASNFFLYTFDGRRITGDDAQRASADESTVLVVFPVTSDEFDDITLATLEAGAVEDSDGNVNPIGDAPIGAGVTFEAGGTDAPDLLGIGNFRPSTATSTATLVDFTFDEPAFVFNAAPGRFQLVQTDGDDLAGTPVENTSTTEDGDFQGDGTTTITVQFPNEDTNGDGTASEPISDAGVARGVVDERTLSDEDQVANGTPLTGDPVAGNLNPLQAVEGDAGSTTAVPDLVSATINEQDSTVTYVFDEDVMVVDETLFRVYDRTGAETTGTAVAGTDSDPDDTTVVVVFPAGSLDVVTGASVDEGAVRESGTATTTPVNQEDEVGVASPRVRAGSTIGPDLTDVVREVQSRSTTDPFTGEVTTEVTGVTIRFLFDDEAATAGSGFFVVNPAGESTPLTRCEQSGEAGEESVVICTTEPQDDPFTLDVDEEAEFNAARDAVLGTVAGGAVTDDEGTDNPEGADVISGA